MLFCFTDKKTNAIALEPVLTSDFTHWFAKQSVATQTWLQAQHFKAQDQQFICCPGDNAHIEKVIIGIKDWEDPWLMAAAPLSLPVADYYVTGIDDEKILTRIFTAWGKGAYQFTKYKAPTRKAARLFVDPSLVSLSAISHDIESHHVVRDLISTPCEDMTPADLAEYAQALAKQYDAKFHCIVGDDALTKENLHAIVAVGRAACVASRLIDFTWGDEQDPHVTLIGKGVCFDTGGLNIKPGRGMALMSKDMGGAAHVLGLAKRIMSNQLKIHLRVLVPAVENAIAGNSYRPGDIIASHSGKSIEIVDTDAEGRLVLADAISYALSTADKPDVLIDFATLTGAARVAVGTDIAAYFTNDETLASQLQVQVDTWRDYMWRLPLFQAYRQEIDSVHANIRNCTASGYGGAIIAALFLQDFIDSSLPWLHIDLMAWNSQAKPGRPIGGEAMGLTSVYQWLASCYANR